MTCTFCVELYPRNSGESYESSPIAESVMAQIKVNKRTFFIDSSELVDLMVHNSGQTDGTVKLLNLKVGF
jgi:hypothetical protein